MKTATVRQLRQELENLSHHELKELCLRLSKFKKENKELLTYLLFESGNEPAYAEKIKEEVDQQFAEINRKNFYLIKKGVRKIHRSAKKFIRYSGNKETEVEILIHFCRKLRTFQPSINRSRVLSNLYARELQAIEKKIALLHEDLQYDFGVELQSLYR